ncbi:MAG: MMPL family transporter, partial [archaeon]
TSSRWKKTSRAALASPSANAAPGGSASNKPTFFDHLDRVQTAQYIEDNYESNTGNDWDISIVYVRNATGDVPSKGSLLDWVRYQQAISENESLETAIHDDGIAGIENFVAIVLALMVVFKPMDCSASLGAVVAIPIALVIGIVIGVMSVLDIPLRLLTALLMSLLAGLGVDYNIHIGGRFTDERRAGKSTIEALEAAITGTGGALLGSTLTTTGAIATIALVPYPQLESFGAIVVIALVTGFLVRVFVLPRLLVLWDRYVSATVTAGRKQ